MSESKEPNPGSDHGEISLQDSTTTADSSTQPQDPVSPPQLPAQHRMDSPPAYLPAERTPSVALAFREFVVDDDQARPDGSAPSSSTQRSLVEQANALINAALGRTPEGSSVI